MKISKLVIKFVFVVVVLVLMVCVLMGDGIVVEKW